MEQYREYASVDPMLSTVTRWSPDVQGVKENHAVQVAKGLTFPEELDRLSADVGTAEKLVVELYDRLSPLLRKPLSTLRAGVEETQPSSLMAEHLRSFHERLAVVIDRLDEITRTLDL